MDISENSYNKDKIEIFNNFINEFLIYNIIPESIGGFMYCQVIIELTSQSLDSYSHHLYGIKRIVTSNSDHLIELLKLGYSDDNDYFYGLIEYCENEELIVKLTNKIIYDVFPQDMEFKMFSDDFIRGYIILFYRVMIEYYTNYNESIYILEKESENNSEINLYTDEILTDNEFYTDETDQY